MMNLKGYFTLNHEIKFSVPSTNYDKEISKEEFQGRTDRIAGRFSKMFGGASIAEKIGYYEAKDGQLITETINSVNSFASDEQIKENAQEILNLAKTLCKEWIQESIAVEIDGRLIIVE